MAWKEIAATPSHRSYLLLSVFLVLYTLFSAFIRNRLHLSEPPLALLFGICLGPKGLGWLTPNACNAQTCLDQDYAQGWGWGDNIIQEITRVVLGIQVFTIGVEMPKGYLSRHWRSVAMLLGPVMTFGWLICALLAHLIFKLDASTALVIAATLTPTDPVLSSSILSNSRFSTRVPPRIRRLLSSESGLNDGIAFPFIYIGLNSLINVTAGQAIKEYILITILWQCCAALALGTIIGTLFGITLRFSDARKYIDSSGMIAFYLLLAILCVGVGSTLGMSEFLVAFSAGYGYARDVENKKHTKDAHLPQIVDLMLNSTMFVYFGAIIPWHAFSPQPIAPYLTTGRLALFAFLVLCFRRIPANLATYQWIPDIRTLSEAVFCGHFGPMGLGALFMATEARAVLETGTSAVLPHPPLFEPPYSNTQRAIEMVWPVAAFVVLCSTVVHGCSVLIISIASHLRRDHGERASLLGAESEPLDGMDHEPYAQESENDDSD